MSPSTAAGRRTRPVATYAIPTTIAALIGSPISSSGNGREVVEDDRQEPRRPDEYAVRADGGDRNDQKSADGQNDSGEHPEFADGGEPGYQHFPPSGARDVGSDGDRAIRDVVERVLDILQEHYQRDADSGERPVYPGKSHGVERGCQRQDRGRTAPGPEGQEPGEIGENL
ncbi:MAG: hypothetical protein QMD46_00375 [Methanomicrobiales archaeon]|nr:hypothetical protein [Methanomicrobiales archaeon]